MATLRKGSIQLSASHPNLLKEWDYAKNMDLSPDDVSCVSERKVWWICSEGHSWEARIYTRTKMNCGCPYCSGRRVISGVNDLLTLNPNVAVSWDYVKNEPLLPSEVACKSNKKVWWICENNHSYEAVIGNRTRDNNGCPYCSGQRTLSGFNDFQTWCINNGRKDLIEEWDYEKNTFAPDCISPKNSKKVWWKCSLGHEWDSTIGSRTSSRPSGCPYCSNPPKRVLVGYNDFESWCINNGRDSLLKEWDYEKNEITPREVTYASGKKVWWKCDKKHNWITAVSQRTTGSKTNCPVCARTQTSFPEQAIAFYLMKEYDILQRYRIKGKELDVYIPEYKIGIEYDGMIWHSEKRQHEQDLLKTQILAREGIHLIRIKENKEKEYIDYENQQTVISFVAECGRYITDSFAWAINALFKEINGISGKNNIPSVDMQRDELSIRAHYMNELKINSVASIFPELVPEWDVEKNKGVLPSAYSAFNNGKVWWKCSKGHSWKASINTRGKRKFGCPYCAGQKVITGHNDFESWCKENRQNLLDEWDYTRNTVLPSEIPRTYKGKVLWKCSIGHEWGATVYNRVNGTGCPVCNKCDATKRNKLSLLEWCQQNNSLLCDEWNYKKNEDLKPSDVTHGSHKIVWWKCSNGHEWSAQVKSRTYNHG